VGLQGLWPWALLAVLFLGLPWVFHSNASLTVLSLIGINIVFALSYNMLFGQTGLLSFGHAVYYGLGAYFTMHALNGFVAAGIAYPVEFLPLVGGAVGLAFGAVLGFLTTRRAGITFALISLGIGVLVASLAIILRHFFGGDGGLSGDPTQGTHWFGDTLAHQIQVYYFVAAWCAVCIVAVYFYTKTPLGHIANAVRDNPERAEFIGYNPHQVRFRVHTLAGLFAGIAGGMAALTNGIVTPDALGFVTSGEVLMMVYIGGAGIFFGPIIGAAIITFMQVLLSNYTNAWQLYIGLFFVAVVMYVPGGVANLFKIHMPVVRYRQLGRLLPAYALMLTPASVFILDLVFMVQMAYQFHSSSQIFLNQSFSFLGIGVEVHSGLTWALALLILAAAIGAGSLAARYVNRAWDDVAAHIKAARGEAP